MIGTVLFVAVGVEPGGPTGVVKFETAMLVHIMGSNVSVTVRGTVVPPKPWLVNVAFVGPGPGVGTLRGGAVAGIETVTGAVERTERGKVG
jgi:hypothetical protein